MAFTCQICFERFASAAARLSLGPLHTGNGDVLRAADCEHPVCQSCMAAYVRVRIHEQRVYNLRCPMLECRVELYEQDLRRLVSAGLEEDSCERFVELRARDFSARVQSFEDMSPKTREDEDLLLCLHDMRRCPRCKLLMQRSGGCNSFFCICGQHFHYATAERAVGTGVKHFKWILQLARGQQLQISESLRFGGDLRLFKKCMAIAALLNLPRLDALDLQKQATAGDKQARVRIRDARSSISRLAVEKRVANDGVAYSREEFIRYYGRTNGRCWWNACLGRAIKPVDSSQLEHTASFVVPLQLACDATVWIPLQQLLNCQLTQVQLARRGCVSRFLLGPWHDWHLREPAQRFFVGAQCKQHRVHTHCTRRSKLPYIRRR